MRTNTQLLKMEDYSIFLQYLYLTKENTITINNGLTNLELYMGENLEIYAKNLLFPNTPPLYYSEKMTPSYIMLALIPYLEKQPAKEFPQRFKNRWDEIKEITKNNTALNWEFIQKHM